MANVHIAALHDRIDEEHFEMRLHASAIQALQRRVNLLEAAVRELRRLAFDDEDHHPRAEERLVDGLPRTGGAHARRRQSRRVQGR